MEDRVEAVKEETDSEEGAVVVFPIFEASEDFRYRNYIPVTHLWYRYNLPL
jgi:hypothetical protein